MPSPNEPEWMTISPDGEPLELALHRPEPRRTSEAERLTTDLTTAIMANPMSGRFEVDTNFGLYLSWTCESSDRHQERETFWLKIQYHRPLEHHYWVKADEPIQISLSFVLLNPDLPSYPGMFGLKFEGHLTNYKHFQTVLGRYVHQVLAAVRAHRLYVLREALP